MIRKEKRREPSLKSVVIKYVVVPDAEQRIARSIDLILRAADNRFPLEYKKSSDESPKTNPANSNEDVN